MARFIAAGRASVLALLVSAPAAVADVTAEQVWTDWRSFIESGGQQITVGSETTEGGTLTLTDLAIRMETPEGTTTAALSELVFVEQGDGTVRIEFAPEYRMNMAMRPAEGTPTDMTLVMTHQNLQMVASGTPEDISYDYSADRINVSVEGVESEGQSVPMDVGITANGVEGSYSVGTTATGRAIASETAAGSVDVAVKGSDPETGGAVDMTMTLADISSRSTAALPAEYDASDLGAMLRAGMTAEGSLSYATASYDMNIDEGGEATAVAGTSGTGTLDFSLRDDAVSYGTTGRDIDLRMSGSALPLPEIALAMEESAFTVRLPVVASDEPREFGLLTALRGVTISDGLWAMFDPGAVLPRVPATVALDLAGQGRWFVDILNPEAAAGATQAPGELSALTLRDLQVSLAGAELTGTGDFTFDNTDTTTFGGMPAPQGAIDLQLVGGNSLLDRLVQLGFLPEDQAMGARMMLGLFARPGAGEDTLVSKIEVNEAGEVLANGQRIR